MNEADLLSRLREITGVEDTTIKDALNQWLGERETIGELFNEVQSLRLYVVRMRMAFLSAERIIESIRNKKNIVLGVAIDRRIVDHVGEAELFRRALDEFTRIVLSEDMARMVTRFDAIKANDFLSVMEDMIAVAENVADPDTILEAMRPMVQIDMFDRKRGSDGTETKRN